GCVSDPVGEGDVCTDDGWSCTDDVCANGACRHTPLDARCDTGEPCAPTLCDPAQSDANAAGCAPVFERVQGDACVEDGDPCTGAACTAGGCAHTAVPSKATCDPVRSAYERALALAGSARSLMALVVGAFPAEASGLQAQAGTTLRGGAANVESTFDMVARILAGRAPTPPEPEPALIAPAPGVRPADVPRL